MLPSPDFSKFGFKMPLRFYLAMSGVFHAADFLKVEATPGEPNTVGFDITFEKLYSFFTSQEQPFDGVIGFSQGAIVFRYFQAIAEELQLEFKHPLPNFFISFSGPYIKV